MNAGRELDALIAETVMGANLNEMCEGEMGDYYDGWMCFKCGEYGSWSEMDKYENHRVHLRHYSTRIEDAWQVVEKIGLSIIKSKDGYLAGRYDLEQEYLDVEMGVIDGHLSLGYVDAPTAPLAICLAALKAVGYEVPS
jgi:hypothetical protein